MSHHKRIIILGGGWSVKEQGVDVNHLKNFGHVIGVNESGVLADVHEIVSMDRLWMESRWPQISKKKIPTFLRESAFRKNLKGQELWDDLHLFQNDHESWTMDDDMNTLNGFNSGFCALNRAFHLRPDEIFIFGFDHKRSPDGRAYWHDPYPWTDARGATKDGKYVDWSKKFLRAASQFHDAAIDIANVSPQSALMNFTKINYQEFLSLCVN